VKSIFLATIESYSRLRYGKEGRTPWERRTLEGKRETGRNKIGTASRVVALDRVLHTHSNLGMVNGVRIKKDQEHKMHIRSSVLGGGGLFHANRGHARSAAEITILKTARAAWRETVATSATCAGNAMGAAGARRRTAARAQVAAICISPT
jgi:hypothetical protein